MMVTRAIPVAIAAAGAIGVAGLLGPAPSAAASEDDDVALRRRASEALARATTFYRERVAAGGGYLWRYSDDLTRREGEGKAGDRTVWVQPPGTPAVGMAYLDAWRATGDARYLDAARETATCLVRGQLVSGGWDYRIELDPDRRRRWAYRVDGDARDKRNVTTLDDDTTQAALRLLIRVDDALDHEDAAIAAAVVSGLDALANAQYPNGAWPQRFTRPPDPARFPVRPAGYPESWPRKHPRKDYRGLYTLNDDVIANGVETMLLAWRLRGDERWLASAKRAGEFLLLAQMPEPQPAWAQQYDVEMHPAWARKFEPPAVTGGESHGAMRTLLRLARATGEARWLEPLPRAIAYLRRSLLPDGRLARFYELESNRPLYFTRGYELTHDDGDLPTHYAFKVGSGLDAIERELGRTREQLERPRESPPAGRAPTDDERRRVRQVVEALDAEGRWVEEGRLRYHGADDPTRRIIDGRTFIRNVRVLARYLAASRPRRRGKLY